MEDLRFYVISTVFQSDNIERLCAMVEKISPQARSHLGPLDR